MPRTTSMSRYGTRNAPGRQSDDKSTEFMTELYGIISFINAILHFGFLDCETRGLSTNYIFIAV